VTPTTTVFTTSKIGSGKTKPLRRMLCQYEDQEGQLGVREQEQGKGVLEIHGLKRVVVLQYRLQPKLVVRSKGKSNG
jgi:hypothetical protein